MGSSSVPNPSLVAWSRAISHSLVQAVGLQDGLDGEPVQDGLGEPLLVRGRCDDGDLRGGDNARWHVQLPVLQEGEQPLGPGLALPHEPVDLIDEQDVAVSHHLQGLGCVLVADQPGELDHAGAQLVCQ